MNSFVLNTISRYVLNAIGAVLASHGLINGETWQTVIGVATAAVTAGIGAYTSRDAAAVQRVNGIPGVVAVPTGHDPAGNGS